MPPVSAETPLLHSLCRKSPPAPEKKNNIPQIRLPESPRNKPSGSPVAGSVPQSFRFFKYHFNDCSIRFRCSRPARLCAFPCLRIRSGLPSACLFSAPGLPEKFPGDSPENDRSILPVFSALFIKKQQRRPENTSKTPFLQKYSFTSALLPESANKKTA